MRLAVLALGTRGDVYPIVALGAELRRRGYEVVLGLSANLLDVAHRLRLDAVPVGWDTQRAIESPEGRAWVDADDPETFTRRMYELTREHDERVDAEVTALCAGADAIVTGVLLEPRAAALAEANGVPLIVQDYFPRRLNGVIPHPLISPEPLPTEAATRATYVRFARLNQRYGGAALAAFRRGLGLAATAGPGGPRALELQAYSPTLTPELTWEAHRPYVGDLRLGREDLAVLGGAALEPDLEAWLAAGEPPALVTFGSTFIENPARLLDQIGQVCGAAGLRALVVAGWGLAGASSQLRTVSYVDYDVVLPRCALVVHHGSATVTAAGVRAGLPTLVCSSSFDQPFWGVRLQRLGIGVHLPLKDLSLPALSAGIGRLQAAPLRARAAEFGTRLRAEPDGTPTAADHIERHLRTTAHQHHRREGGLRWRELSW